MYDTMQCLHSKDCLIFYVGEVGEQFNIGVKL